MTSDQGPGSTRHPRAQAPGATCACGQELDTCTHQHCPRCGAVLPRAA